MKLIRDIEDHHRRTAERDTALQQLAAVTAERDEARRDYEVQRQQAQTNSMAMDGYRRTYEQETARAEAAESELAALQQRHARLVKAATWDDDGATATCPHFERTLPKSVFKYLCRVHEALKGLAAEPRQSGHVDPKERALVHADPFFYGSRPATKEELAAQRAGWARAEAGSRGPRHAVPQPSPVSLVELEEAASAIADLRLKVQRLASALDDTLQTLVMLDADSDEATKRFRMAKDVLDAQ